MSETIDTPAASDGAGKKRGGGLSTMLLADLRSLAGGLGVTGAGSMKKAQLVEAIRSAQSGGAGAPAGRTSSDPAPERAAAPESSSQSADAPVQAPAEAPKVVRRTRKPRQVVTAEPEAAPAEQTPAPTPEPSPEPAAEPAAVREARRRREPEVVADETTPEPRNGDEGQQGRRQRSRNRSQDGADETTKDTGAAPEADTSAARDDQGQARGQDAQRAQGQDRSQDRAQDRSQGQDRDQQDNQDQQEGEGEGRRNRRRRGRDRDRTNRAEGNQANGQTNAAGQGNQDRAQGNQGNQDRQGNPDRQDRQDRAQGPRGQREPDTTILEDDVLVPAAGILDVLDNYAFVRTSGYLPGTDDVYVSLSMVRKFGLRRGDAVMGQVRQPREGERKEKFNPMVHIDSVNGADPDAARTRVDFSSLTPVYPTQRLRLETDPSNVIGRMIDITAPIGKGQRGLIVSPARTGRTTILQSIASSISANNPECHLMVVLVDERPEEVTDYERSVKGEVIASTFDRAPADHTVVAELAIERAKRLVELGHDVVVLLDGITRLGRAYNMVSPSSGRTLSGGVDSASIHPPKQFFGAARNIEDGGSLTILATALVESGSATDEVIFEEFTGTDNMELRLRRDLADKGLFPAIDAVQSGTRREELLMSAEELAIVVKLRRALADLDGAQGLESLLGRLGRTQTNIELLMQLKKAPAGTV